MRVGRASSTSNSFLSRGKIENGVGFFHGVFLLRFLSIETR